MCGIIGTTNNDGKKGTEEGLKLLKHRGPDDSGILFDEGVFLGHRRLSIIDLSPSGHQPMVSGRFKIVFNGEIYNYKELKGQLESKGVIFESQSDTEAILKGYGSEGIQFFSKMRGMWAFVIYDQNKNEIILSRDHFGIKPLLYSIQNNNLSFASEMKALRKLVSVSPNTDRYFEFYNLGYFVGENTCFKEVKKVLPGEVITWNLKIHSLKSEFLSVEEQEKKNMSFEESVNYAEEILLDSVEKHYIADVDVGLLLSGGTDSSLIASLSKKLGKKPISYHMAIPGSIDTEYARKIGDFLKFKFVEKEFSKKSLEEEYQNMKNWLDEPSSDVSLIPTALVYKAVGKTNKVVLSGEGGDELLGGYLRHSKLLGLNKLEESKNFLNNVYSTSSFGLNFTNPVIRRLEDKFSKNILDVYLQNSKTMAFPINHDLLKKRLLNFYNNHPYKSLTSKNLFFDQFLYLPNLLMYKNDMASMQSSIEARVPLVDIEVSKAVAKIEDKFRFSMEYPNKKILKEILKRYLPKELVERPKKGFGFSFDKIGASFFLEDYKKAAKFHLENADEFGVNQKLKNLLSISKADIVCKKFPRFAFSMITNYLIMKDL